MFDIVFIPITTDEVRALQAGNLDANGHAPEKYISDGDGVPCRHCLAGVDKGEPYLLLSHRPFTKVQPYAEIGPIFLHHKQCESYSRVSEIPPMLSREQYIVRGYDVNERIVPGTGRIVKTAKIRDEAIELLRDPRISYLHVRSATNNCYHCRINRVIS